MAESQSVKMSYGKAALSFIGADSVHVLMILLIITCTGLIVWIEDSSRKAILNSQTTIQNNQGEIIKLLREGQQHAERASIIQTYVLSLSQPERDKLRLAEPPELRNGYR